MSDDFLIKKSSRTICSPRRRVLCCRKRCRLQPAFPFPSAPSSAERVGAESKEIPTKAQVSPRGGNGAVVEISDLPFVNKKGAYIPKFFTQGHQSDHGNT